MSGHRGEVGVSTPSVHDMLTSLTIDGHAPVRALPWLEESWRDGARFLRDLQAMHATALPARPKSVVLERYDLHFDLIGRNATGDRPALRWQDRDGQWQALSCAQLDQLSARRAAAWASHGVEAGQTVCLILPFGPEWVIALLAVVRLGCVLSFLPPAGERFYARRLAALAPDHVVTTELHAAVLGEHRARVIPPDAERRGQAAAAPATAVVPAGATFARLFSPLGPRTDAPIAVSIDDAYGAALRDGLLVHGLRPFDALAAPGVDLLQYQPGLLLATLLAGGTYVHVELEALARAPATFAGLSLATVGVVPRLRDLLLEAGLQLGRRWGHWWRGVSEDGDVLRWQRFVSEAGLASVPTSALLCDPATGGASLFSPRRRLQHGGTSMHVLPAAGAPWGLAPLGGPASLEAAARAPERGLGVLVSGSLLGPQAGSGSHVLSRSGHEWLFGGTRLPARAGRCYPADEVADAVEGLPFLEGAVVVGLPTADPGRPHVFTLVGFVGRARTAALAVERDAWRGAIEARIADGLAPDLLPDRIELLPFSPRRRDKDGRVDLAWCSDRLARGLLHERVSGEVYLLLDELRALAAAPASEPADLVAS